MQWFSVEPSEPLIDSHGASQRSVEGFAATALEACEPPAGVLLDRGRGWSSAARRPLRGLSPTGALRPQPAHVRMGVVTTQAAPPPPARGVRGPSAAGRCPVPRRAVSSHGSSSFGDLLLARSLLALRPRPRLRLLPRARLHGHLGRCRLRLDLRELLVRRHTAETGARQRRVRAALAVAARSQRSDPRTPRHPRRRRMPPRPRPARTRARTGCPPSSPSAAAGGRSVPSLPIASASWSSGTITVASFRSSSGTRARAATAPWRRSAARVLARMMSIFSAQLGHDVVRDRAGHADADRVDALRMRLDRDLRAVAGLARHRGSRRARRRSPEPRSRTGS